MLALSLITAMVVPTTASASNVSNVRHTLKISSTLADSISASLPFVRLSFSGSVRASSLPALVTTPALATTWQQIGPREVQAVATGALLPSTAYSVELPAAMTCAARCAFRAERASDVATTANDAWEQQLLAQLHYLPANFTPTAPPADPSQPLSGVYAWAYPGLPTSISALWGVGNDNVIVRGALMAFQDNNNLPTTGVVDTSTWHALVKDVRQHTLDPDTYNYVTVSEGSPELLHLYISGHVTFQTLVNTGISVAPTPLGTFPVYLRYVVTTMSGFNPDGTHYDDPGIPWVSYFSGGSALHGFIRASYGWPQSLGCVEMPFASAQVIWPHTPIGTLVTVEIAS